MTKLLTTTAAALLLAGGLGAAQAATTTNTTSTTPPVSATAGPVEADANAMSSTDQMAKMSIRQQIQDQLTKTGYTDVNVMPSSFYIRAKDKQGNPVAMVVGPDSFTTVTEMPMGSSAKAGMGAAATGTGTAATTKP